MTARTLIRIPHGGLEATAGLGPPVKLADILSADAPGFRVGFTPPRPDVGDVEYVAYVLPVRERGHYQPHTTAERFFVFALSLDTTPRTQSRRRDEVTAEAESKAMEHTPGPSPISLSAAGNSLGL